MNEFKNKIHVHILNIETGRRLDGRLLAHLPRVGDELRLKIEGETYWTVKCVVWCLDEEESPYTRVNIGVERIKQNG